MNTCDEISKHNLFNLLNKPKITYQFINKEEVINKVQIINYNNINLYIYNNLYNKENTNLENENKELTIDLIKLISMVIYEFDTKQKNFNIDYIQSLNFIKDFLALVINLHIFYIESKQFSKIYF